MIYITLALTWGYVIKLRCDNKKLEFYKDYYINKRHNFGRKEVL